MNNILSYILSKNNPFRHGYKIPDELLDGLPVYDLSTLKNSKTNEPYILKDNNLTSYIVYCDGKKTYVINETGQILWRIC